MSGTGLDTAKGVLAYLSWRLAMVVLLTVPLFLGGVWFVVDVSLRGLETAVSTTNTRITDLRSDLKNIDMEILEKINPKFEKLISQMNNLEKEFKSESTSIKDFMKRVSIENENLSLSFWTTEKVEIGFPTSLTMPLLEDFISDASYSDLKKNLIFDNSTVLSDIKIVPLLDDTSFSLARTQNINLGDYLVTAKSDVSRLKTVIQKLSDCVKIKQISSQKMIIQTTNSAIVLQGTIGCPIVTMNAMRAIKTNR